MRTLRAAAFALLFALASAGPLAAGPLWPELTIGIGGTAGVSGSLDNGGFSLWGSGLWPVDGPWSFGVIAFADDMGNRIVDVNDGGSPPQPLGVIEERHRFVYGGGWKMAARLPSLGRWEPGADAIWTYTRIQDDARGTVLYGESTLGLGIGMSIRRPVLQHSTVGVALRYHHLNSDTVDGYFGGGVEWGWRFGKTP